MLIILLYKQQIINFIDHQLNGVTNSAGWIFMNYRNDKENFDKNTILYGHVRLNYIWQVFSTYKIKTTSDYLQTDFSTNDEYMALLNMIENRSVNDYNIKLASNGNIISLSICHNDSKYNSITC